MALGNPLKKQAQMNVLKSLIGKPTAEAVTPVGPLATLKNTEKKQMESAPLTTGKGIKESLTKKIKPKF